jgi:hypothetical protein
MFRLKTHKELFENKRFQCYPFYVFTYEIFSGWIVIFLYYCIAKWVAKSPKRIRDSLSVNSNSSQKQSFQVQMGGGGGGGGVCRKFESFVGNLGGFATPTGKSEFPPLDRFKDQHYVRVLLTDYVITGYNKCLWGCTGHVFIFVFLWILVGEKYISGLAQSPLKWLTVFCNSLVLV